MLTYLADFLLLLMSIGSRIKALKECDMTIFAYHHRKTERNFILRLIIGRNQLDIINDFMCDQFCICIP